MSAIISNNYVKCAQMCLSPVLIDTYWYKGTCILEVFDSWYSHVASSSMCNTAHKGF